MLLILRRRKPLIKLKTFIHRRAACPLAIVLLALGAPALIAETVSPLTARGYTALPIPQKVILGPQDFGLTDDWQISLERGVKSDDVAVVSLKEDLF